MTNNPDLVLKSHGAVARDPSSWLRMRLGCRENGETQLGLGGPPHCTQAHISTASERHTHTVPHQQTLPNILSPAASLPSAYKTPEGENLHPALSNRDPSLDLSLVPPLSGPPRDSGSL